MSAVGPDNNSSLDFIEKFGSKTERENFYPAIQDTINELNDNFSDLIHNDH